MDRVAWVVSLLCLVTAIHTAVLVRLWVRPLPRTLSRRQRRAIDAIVADRLARSTESRA